MVWSEDVEAGKVDGLRLVPRGNRFFFLIFSNSRGQVKRYQDEFRGKSWIEFGIKVESEDFINERSV